MLVHIHVTHNTPVDVPPGWKLTEIILQGDQERKDWMLTKYFQLSPSETLADLIAWAKTLECERFKIEQVNEFSLAVSPEHYVEIHVKVPEGSVAPDSTFIRSMNPSQIIDGKPVYFFNRRIYESDLDVETTAENVRQQLISSGVQFTEFKVEQILFDSNREHDSWWG